MFSFVAAARNRNVKAAARRVQGKNHFANGVQMGSGDILQASWSGLGKKCPKTWKNYFCQSLLEVLLVKKAKWFAKWFLPWTLLALASTSTSQERSLGDIWTHNCAPRLLNELQKESKITANRDFLSNWGMCVPHTKYHAFLHAGPS